MRLSNDEICVIKESVAVIDKDAELYLFGSRADDSKLGGDIDILIFSDKITRASKRKIRNNFFDRFGEQRFDIVTSKRNTGDQFSDPFVKRIFQDAIKL